MVKQEQIPILKNNSYHRSYFQHLPGRPVNAEFFNGPYFEIHQKCIWKNNIPAHRLDFYMVFLVTRGEGIQTFGLKEHYIRKNMLCFVGPNMINSWKSESDDHQGYCCTFSEEFFNAGSVDKHFLQELSFFQIEGNSVLHLTDQQTEYYSSLFKTMRTEFENRNEYSDPILRSLLQVLLRKSYSQFKTMECTCPAPDDVGLRLLRSFTAAFLRDLATIRTGNGVHLKKISEYADELGVSQNHLNDTIKAITGRSAGQLIKNQLTRQASMCLMHAHKSISEISYALGFDDPSYFARFYKNQTGQTPSEFRLKRNL
ncbi:MAG TPA: AraC family transcriptional regulator [Chryseosolibacter sp.]